MQTNNIFYVYVHRRLTDNKPFYVGKGKGNRAFVSTGRNKYWKNTKDKYGFSVEIVFENLTEEEAFQCEKDTILEFKYFGYPLTNLTDGGDGTSGYKVSAEAKKCKSLKMSDKRIYTFISKDGLIKTCTRMELISSENLDRVSFSQLFNKNINLQQSCGWGILQNNEEIHDALKRINSARKLSKIDQTKYSFVNKNGLNFYGTRLELCEKFNLDQNRLCELFSKRKRKSTMGWSINKEQNDTKY